MGKPVILAIDDDPDVLVTVENDLRAQFGADYRVMRAESGADGLDTLKRLRLRGDAVALLLVDQRMPGMTGVEFLERAVELYADARRVLLTAYADTEAAIQAINVAKIHYYLLKPWHPPEEQLYPVIQDQLDEWQANYRQEYEGLRIVGYRWAPDGHQLRTFLARNLIPYRWVDLEADAESRTLLYLADATEQDTPLVILPDGTSLVRPTLGELAERCGLRTHTQRAAYDLVIIGGGPAGLAAAVYGASEGLHTVLIEREAPGGQAGTSSRIENYLGFPAGLSGGDLTRRAVTQAKRLGAELIAPQEVKSITVNGPYKLLRLADDCEISTSAVVIATGVSYRRLDVPGAERLTGAGVYYGAALTEAQAIKGEDIYIVGSGNSAGQAAVYFARFAKSVTVLIRTPSLVGSMSQYLIDQIVAAPNIEVLGKTHIKALEGTDRLEAVTIWNAETDETQTRPASSLFIFIGAVPRTDWLDGLVARDSEGYILSGTDLLRNNVKLIGEGRDPLPLETSVPGIFVAGDVRHGSIKRIASAVGEGSMAVQFIHRYLGAR